MLSRTFDRVQLIEATMLVGPYQMLAGCLNSFGVELDEGLEPLPGGPSAQATPSPLPTATKRAGARRDSATTERVIIA